LSRNRWIGLIAALWVSATAVVLFRQAAVQHRNADRIGQLERDNAELQARLGASRTAAPPPRVPEPEPAAPARPAPVAHTPAENPAREAEFETVRSNLAQANSTIAQLEARINELQNQVQQLGNGNKQLSEAERDASEAVASARRVIEEHERELKTRSDRIGELELANQRLRDQGKIDAQKVSQMTPLITELQDLHRRREGVLRNILRRYKEVTDQYRALSGMLDSRAQSTVVAAGPDLARIQNAISLAEDDLRQLNSLDAAAGQVQKKMAALR
jgi:DNA repair exonuclease SbcCD ATPase subunit